MAEGDVKVEKTSYGCTITDISVYETVAIELGDIPQLIRDLQALLPWEFNEVAMPKLELDDRAGQVIRELWVHDHNKPMFTLPEDRDDVEEGSD